MSDIEQRDAMVNYWWERALGSLASARREFEAKEYLFAMNRIYYAAFYAVSAALLDRNLSFKKHSGVRATFHQEFVKTNLIDLEWGKFYDRLFEDRQEGDYAVLVSFEPDYVKNQLEQCVEFLDKIRPLIKSLNKQ